MYPGGPAATAPGVHAAQWAGDPAVAHLEVEKRRVSICFQEMAEQRGYFSSQ